MIWFTSDTHFWHKRVIEYCGRPWGTVQAMNEALVNRWNEVVAENDSVFVLGDFAFCGSTEIKRILGQLKGHKHLVMGNHDWRYGQERWIEFGFLTATRELATMANGWTLCHFPYKGSGDHTAEERYEGHRPEDKGCWLLHGHVHNAWRTKGRMFNVGVDRNGYRPVSMDEVRAVVDELEAAGAT